jgi:hypothetical protein
MSGKQNDQFFHHQRDIMKQIRIIILLCLLTFLTPPLSTQARGGPVGYGLTSGRLVSILTGVAGIVGIVAGARSLKNSPARNSSRRVAFMAIVIGSFCSVMSFIHFEASKGGFGTGSGKAGAIVGFFVGLTAITLGTVSVSRRNRS